MQKLHEIRLYGFFYFTRILCLHQFCSEFLGARETADDIDRKIRAFFFPPYRGATITIHDHKFTLLNDEVLKFISQRMKKKKIC